MDLKRTNSDDIDFRSLVTQLDQELTMIYGEKQTFFSQFNTLQQIQHVIVVYADDRPVACGAIKKFDRLSMEVKRMYVSPTHRQKGIAKAIMSELESWTKELRYYACVLETGNKQLEAIGLYNKVGYSIIPNYGQYKDVEESICMKKNLAFDPF